MEIYVIVLVLISAQALIALLINKHVPPRTDDASSERTSLFLKLVCFELICVAGLRATNIGADTQTYIDALQHYKGISFSEVFTAPLVWPFDFEIGYFVLTKLCAFWDFSPTVFLFLVAILIYIPTFLYIDKNSSHPYVSVLAYFAFGIFGYSLGIFRQMIAIGIILMSLKHIQNRNFVRFCISVFVAMLFHTTALITLPLYFVVRVNWKKRGLIIAVFALELFFLLFGRPIIQYAVVLLPSYAGYIGGQYDVQGGSYLNLIFLDILLLFYCAMGNSHAEKSENYNLNLSLLIGAVLLQSCAYQMGLFGRIVPYYSIAAIVVLPEIIDAIGKKDRNLKGIALGATCLMLYLLIFRSFAGDTFICPYKFIGQ